MTREIRGWYGWVRDDLVNDAEAKAKAFLESVRIWREAQKPDRLVKSGNDSPEKSAAMMEANRILGRSLIELRKRQ